MYKTETLQDNKTQRILLNFVIKTDDLIPGDLALL